MTAPASRQAPQEPAADGFTGPGTARAFDYQRVWRLTAGVFEQAARMLADCEPVPDAVIGIARGGVPLARILGGCYRVPVLEIRATHNRSDDIYAQATGVVELADASLPAGILPSGLSVLVADDICGTGATVRAVLPRIEARLRPSRLRVAVLCRNAAASAWLDSWLWDTRDWVVFPWDTAPAGPTEPLTLPAAVQHGRPA